MKPNNEFTTPDNRFFYPDNHSIEHHESLDITQLPQAKSIPGCDHYLLIGDATGDAAYAVELAWGNYNVPANTTVLAVKGQSEDSATAYQMRGLLDPLQFESFDGGNYKPEENDDVQIIVQVDSRFRYEMSDDRFDQAGIAILPSRTALPNVVIKSGSPHEQAKYRLLGFIDSADKLVTWHSERSYAVLLVDWCVANQLKQNRLEEALLHDSLPQGAHLVGLLSTHEAASAYLRYFDTKHGTTYVPREDPRFSPSGSKFGEFTDADRQEYRRLTSIAHYFMTHPR